MGFFSSGVIGGWLPAGYPHSPCLRVIRLWPSTAVSLSAGGSWTYFSSLCSAFPNTVSSTLVSTCILFHAPPGASMAPWSLCASDCWNTWNLPPALVCLIVSPRGYQVFLAKRGH